MGFDGDRELYFLIGGEYMIFNHLIPNFGGEICPYVGCDVGVALVNKAALSFYSNSSIDEQMLEKDSDGFFGGIRFGIMLFRNHAIKFMPEIRAINVFNKDWDKGIRATVGMMLAF